jgi:hypothetical protein
MEARVIEQTIRAVADAKDVEPVDLDISLQNWVETDALRQLVDHPADAWRLQFELPEHTVTVTGRGMVLVDGTEERTFS